MTRKWLRRWSGVGTSADASLEERSSGYEGRARQCKIGLRSVGIVMTAALLWGVGAGRVAAQTLGDDAVVGNAAEQDQIHFSLTLPLRNAAALHDLLGHLYTPGDPQFHHFMSSSDFDEKFAPTASQYSALKALASEYGLTVVSEHAGRTLLDVVAPAATVRRVFGAQMRVLQQRDGRRYFSPDHDADVPFPLSAMGADVASLQQKPWHTHYVQRGQVSEADVGKTMAVARAGLGSQGSYVPADIKTAYNLNSIQNGGQTVALFELSSATYSDVTHYASQFGLHIPTLVQKTVDGGTSDTTDAMEVILDIELVMAVSNPGSVVVYTGPNSGSGMIDTYAQIADDNLVNQVSTSWGVCEADQTQSGVNAENSIFSKMATEGIAVFSAAGDAGAYDCGSVAGGISADDPSAQPYVTGVGGTHLTTTSAQGYSAESVWNTSITEAGGGGISRFWSIPSFQAGVVSNAPTGQFSSTLRNVPDVSLNADPATGYLIYGTSSGQAGWWIIGGTSAAAPQWAAFWSLVGAGLAQKGVTHAGYANPTIYSLAENAATYARDFHDVTTGTNNHYSAVTGYDDATGWGSYNGANLYADLVTALSTPAPKVTISASPTSITAGQAVTLTWSSTNATSCTTSSGTGWSSGISLPASGSLSGSVQAAGTYTYGLTCGGTGGSVTGSATLTVVAASKPTVTLAFSPNAVSVGQSAALTWSSTNATSCTTSSGTGWSSGISLPVSWSLSGAIQTAGSYTYGITCTGSGGSTSAQTTLTVTAVPTVNIAFTPSTIAVGQTATLAWSSVNTSSCVTSGSGWPAGVQLPVSGSVGTGTAPVAGTVTVGLSCTGTGGSVNGSATLQITTN